MVNQGLLDTLPGSTNLMITADSLEREAQTPRRTGRAWSPRIAWAALDLLSGGSAQWLLPAERYRLRQSLKCRSVDDVLATARNRAAATRFRAVPGAGHLPLQHIVPTGSSAMTDPETAYRFGLSGKGSFVDGYVGTGTSGNLAASLGMERDPQGNVARREVDFQDALRVNTPVAAVALDLCESFAIREQSAGAAFSKSSSHSNGLRSHKREEYNHNRSFPEMVI